MEQDRRRGNDEQNYVRASGRLAPGKRTSSPQFSSCQRPSRFLDATGVVRDKLRRTQTSKARCMARIEARVGWIGTFGSPCLAASAACEQRYPWEITGSTRDREDGWWLLLGNEDDAPNGGPRNQFSSSARFCAIMHANPPANLRANSLRVTQLIPVGSACRARYSTRSLIWWFRTCHDWCNLTWEGERSAVSVECPGRSFSPICNFAMRRQGSLIHLKRQRSSMRGLGRELVNVFRRLSTSCLSTNVHCITIRVA